MGVSIWDYEKPKTETLILYDNDIELFVASEFNNSESLKIFRISNGLSDSVYTILKYIEYSYGQKIILNDEGINENEIAFFELWEDFIRGKYDESIFHNRYVPRLFKKFELLLELIAEYKKIKNYFFSTSVLGRTRSVDFEHNWWKYKSNLITDLEHILLRVKKNISYADFYEQLYDYYSELKKFASNINITSNSFLFASVYCFCSGKLAIQSHEYDKSILLLHRSLDLYFIHEGIKAKIIDVSKEGVDYKKEYSTREVTLSITKELLSSRILINKENSKLINKLNYIRNRVILTHSLFSLESDDANLMYDDIYQLILNLDGTNGVWKSCLRLITKKPKVEKTLLFSIEDSFDAYVNIVP